MTPEEVKRITQEINPPRVYTEEELKKRELEEKRYKERMKSVELQGEKNRQMDIQYRKKFNLPPREDLVEAAASAAPLQQPPLKAPLQKDTADPIPEKRSKLSKVLTSCLSPIETSSSDVSAATSTYELADEEEFEEETEQAAASTEQAQTKEQQL